MKTRNTFLGIVMLTTTFSSTLAQEYCIPPGFRDMGGVGEPFTYISNVKLENLDNSSGMPSGVGDDNGYTYYDGMNVPVLQPGNTYSLKVTANDNLGQGMEVGVWIDWNGDKEFDNVQEKVAFWAPDGNHGADITVPTNAKLGVIRMRVGCDMPSNMGHIPLEPCGYLYYPSHSIGQHGEFEDYDIQIGSTTGIVDSENELILKVYPNPVSEQLIIEHDFASETIYTIVDVYGRVHISGRLGSEKSTIDVSRLNAGQYTIMIEGESTVHRPFLVTR